MTTPILTVIPMDEFVADIGQLASNVRASGWAAHFIVGVGRGGLTPATFLSHALDWPLLSVDYSTGASDFSEGLLVKLAMRSSEGERLLFVDDINDSGRTIAHLRRTLKDCGGDLANIRFGVLIDNSRSSQQVDFQARVIDRRVTQDWFVFPWEAVASADTITRDAQSAHVETQ